jgi:cytochrome c556
MTVQVPDSFFTGGNTMFKPVITALTLTTAAALAFTASAQNTPTPEERAVTATETRQAVFKLLGYNMAPINAMVRGEAPFDAEIIERNAQRVGALAPMIPELFEMADTRSFTVETRALPGIWDNQEDFREKAADLESAAGTFASVAAGGDQTQIMGAVRAFGSTCGNCHDVYRD